MPPRKPQPVARAPRPGRERLSTLKGPSQLRRSATPQRSTASRHACPNPACSTPDIQECGGSRVCISCGTLVSESNIVSEVTFGETSAGAAVVQGGFVGEGQRYARSLGSAFKRAGGGEGREAIEHSARTEIRQQGWQLRLPNNVEEQAFQIYKLAAANNFIQGRRVRSVIAICLYVACRRNAQNTALLMDFSELIQVNVFHLGAVYQDMLKDLWLGQFANSGVRPVIEPEPLIMKFARKLEFGTSTDKVAEDAVRIIKRMKRDWMVTGRRPAGLCGACIILAARMNNFRRTVREVVYIVKVTDGTISKRLEEFKRTTSGNLTVDEFRSVGLRLKKQHDPPSVYEAQERERKRRKKAAQLDDDAWTAGSENQNESSTRRSSERPREPRRDADGFVIPDLPIDRRLLEATNAAHAELLASQPSPDDPQPQSSPTDDTNPRSPGSTSAPSSPEPDAPPKRKRGRPKATPPEPITPADLLAEGELEDEIETILADPDALANMEETAFAASQARAKALADTLRSSTSSSSSSTPARAPVPDTPDIGDDEFDSDPEVRNCLLSAAEIAVKERIWVTHNEDWLRAQQARVLRREMEEATAAAGGGGGAGGRRREKTKRTRRRGKLGDGSVLEGDTPVRTPAEANMRMLARRGKGFSRHINYEKLQEIYAGAVESSAGSAGTPRGSVEREAVVGEREAVVEEREAVEERSQGRPNAGTEKSTAAGAGVAVRAEEEEIIGDDDDDGSLPLKTSKAAGEPPPPPPPPAPGGDDADELDEEEAEEEEEEEADEDEERDALDRMGIDMGEEEEAWVED